MNRKQVLFASLFIGAIALYSCGDDSNPANGNNRVNSMPNAIGMIWNYEVFDSLKMTLDTVSVSIVDSNLGGLQGLKWRTLRRVAGLVSENIAVLRGDTLDFTIDTTFIIPPLERFVFPLSLGSQWTVSALVGKDSSVVTDVASVSVKAGQFVNSAQVERIWNFNISGGHDSSLTWVAPNVGIVSKYLYGTRAVGPALTITKNETWELIDYDLSTFAMSQFSGAFGSELTYEIVDSRFTTPDTVIVSIADYSQIAGFDSTRMWLINGKMITDTQFVAYVNNQVWVSEDTIVNSLFDWRYEFPLSVGRHWGMVTIPEIILPTIDAKESVTTPAGTFPSAFHYTMSGGVFNSTWSVEDWLVPRVGVVKRTYFVSAFIPFGYTQEWTLLSYRLR